MANFSLWLRDSLDERGWTQAEFCRRSGLSQQHVSRIISGVGEPGMDFYEGAARALKLPLDEVLVRAGVIAARNEILPEPRDWSHRLRQFEEAERAAAIQAMDSVLSAVELARQLRRARQAGG